MLDKSQAFFYYIYMNFQQEFYSTFGDKFPQLKLKDVVVKRKAGSCVVTFLYPSTIEEMSDDDKKEVVNWIENALQLEKVSIRCKFMKVFLEERLILKFLQNYFEKKHKLLTSYLTAESFKIEINNIDIIVDIDVSNRMIDFFAEHKIQADLAKELKNDFLVDFVIRLNACDHIVDEVDIVNVEMKTTYKPVKRYEVEVIKDIIGKNIVPRPEFLSYIKSAKKSAIVAGFIRKFEQKTFVAKKGARAGQEKKFYTFILEDGKGKIDCIYFSSKVNEKVMDSLEEAMYVLVQGDIAPSKFDGRLQLMVDKMALATIVESENLPAKPKAKQIEGQVVQIEKLTTTEQANLFEAPKIYDDNINGETIVVVDLETTGLDSEVDEITEIGAVKIVDGVISEKFATFVKPSITIPKEVTDLTGITNEMVANAPEVQYVLKDFYEFAKGATLCGHNIINFDLKFVRRIGSELGLEFDNPVLDTLNLARESKHLFTSYKLGTIVKYFDLTLEGAHRAWNDAYATAEVLLKLCEKH